MKQSHFALLKTIQEILSVDMAFNLMKSGWFPLTVVDNHAGMCVLIWFVCFSLPVDHVHDVRLSEARRASMSYERRPSVSGSSHNSSRNQSATESTTGGNFIVALSEFLTQCQPWLQVLLHQVFKKKYFSLD